MHQLIDQPTRVDDKTSSVLDVILMSHPTLYRRSAVLKYTLTDHYLIYHSHITCDISANDFNHHFANISKK